MQSLGLLNNPPLPAPCATPAPAPGPGYALPARSLLCPASTEPDDAEGYTPSRQRVDPIRHPYVPHWLPFRLEREFLRRFREAMQRAKARRGGRWRSHLDEALTTGRVLGGLHTAYRYGRTSSEWGRRMRGKRGQKALQRKVAEQGWRVSGYFAELGRRGGLAKARKRYQPYLEKAAGPSGVATAGEKATKFHGVVRSDTEIGGSLLPQVT